MYIYVHIHTYMHTYIHLYVYPYMYTYRYICISISFYSINSPCSWSSLFVNDLRIPYTWGMCRVQLRFRPGDLLSCGPRSASALDIQVLLKTWARNHMELKPLALLGFTETLLSWSSCAAGLCNATEAGRKIESNPRGHWLLGCKVKTWTPVQPVSMPRKCSKS